MHNLMSHNQLEGWKRNVSSLGGTLNNSIEELDLLNDYYNCLIESNNHYSKQICKKILE